MDENINLLVKEISLKKYNMHYSELSTIEKINVLHSALKIAGEEMQDQKNQSKHDDIISIVAIMLISLSILILSFHF
tara:strand:+ start:3353 stop:3583 length:231 start_codon:yes stop_codon:yes gene_type:complete